MKALIFALMLSVTTLLGADMTNGVFYTDSPVECHLISQNGATVTNQLAAGKTYEVGNALAEIVTTNKATFFISGGPMIEAGPNSTFSINLIDVEVKNLSDSPSKADFGMHNVNLGFGVGEFSIVYPNQDPNSSVTAATPYTSYLFQGGKYFVRITDKSAIVYVLEGMMQVHGDKNRVDNTDKGKLAVAIPFLDPASGVEDKIISSIKPLKQEEMERFATPVMLAEKKWANVQFVVIGGKVIGVRMK